LSSIFGSSHSEGSVNETEASTLPTNPEASDVGQNQKSIRVLLNIQAGAPVILFPYSSTSTALLVTDLGHLAVRNKFLEESTAVIFDCISLDLMEMDLYSAELRESAGPGSGSKANMDESESKSWLLDKHTIVTRTSNSSSFLKSKCALKLNVKRALSQVSSSTQASMSVQGTLSTVYATIDRDKYQVGTNNVQYSVIVIRLTSCTVLDLPLDPSDYS
jgi:hypothetical protein